jgi:hypothetical protein
MPETPEPIFVNVHGALESISPAYVAWQAGATNRIACRTSPLGWESIPGILKRSTNTGSGSTPIHLPWATLCLSRPLPYAKVDLIHPVWNFGLSLSIQTMYWLAFKDKLSFKNSSILTLSCQLFKMPKPQNWANKPAQICNKHASPWTN